MKIPVRLSHKEDPKLFNISKKEAVLSMSRSKTLQNSGTLLVKNYDLMDLTYLKGYVIVLSITLLLPEIGLNG